MSIAIDVKVIIILRLHYFLPGCSPKDPNVIVGKLLSVHHLSETAFFKISLF